MKYRAFKLASSICFLVVAQTSRAAVAELPNNWLKDWDKAVAQAKAEKKPILALFSTDWCGPCQMMIKEIYPKENVKEALKSWVAVYVDGDKSEERTKKFKVDAYPTFVLLSPEATEEDRFVGARPEEEFISMLKNHAALTEKIKDIKTKLEKTPEDPALWKDLADSFEKKTKIPEAITALEKAVYLDPKDKLGILDQLYFLKAVPKSAEDYEESGKKFAAFESQFPKSKFLPKVFLYRGWIAADMDDPEKALEILKEGAKRFSDTEEASQMRKSISEIESTMGKKN